MQAPQRPVLFLNNDVLRTEDIVCKYKLLKQFLQRASTCSTTASRTAQNEAEHYLNVDGFTAIIVCYYSLSVSTTGT